MLKIVMLRSALIAFVCALSVAAHAYAADPKRVDVPAGDLTAALETLAKQSGVELVYQSKQLKGLRTKGLTGKFTAEEAVTKLLEGTPLTFRKDESGAMLIAPPKSSLTTSQGANPSPGTGEGGTAQRGVREKSEGKRWWQRLAQANPSPGTGEEGTAQRGMRSGESSDTNSQELPAPGDTTKGIPEIPEILVTGSKLLNTDIRRSRDDPQPYVVFSRTTIEQSGAVDLNDFFKNRLTMNTTAATNGQRGNSAGSISSVNLRGLGENQTLVLIDGRRAAKTSGGFTPGQPDINGIPLQAIERIEVLPTTASAIYGGAATGGVINVILRRDYSGADLKLTYDNSFDTDSAATRIDSAAGFNFRGGKTNVLLTASYGDENYLLIKDRDLLERGRANLLAINPTALQPGSIPPLGTTANIRSNTTIGGVLQNLTLDNGTALNSTFTFVPPGYAGGASDGGAALVANAGRYNLDVSSNSAAFGSGGASSFTNKSRRQMFGGSVRHEFTPKLQAFLEASHAENNGLRPIANTLFVTLAANAPTNPFQQSIRVFAPTTYLNGINTSKSDYDRVAGGVIFKLPGDWMAAGDYTFTVAELSSSRTPANPDLPAAITNGSVDPLRDNVDLSPYVRPNEFTVFSSPLESTTKDAVLRFSGPIGSLPAGRPQLSMLLERQRVAYDTAFQTQISTLGDTAGTFFPDRSQAIDSVYAELRVPLLKSLELQLAARRDDYRTVNANSIRFVPPAMPSSASATYIRNEVADTNPLVGLRFQPNQQIALRGSYGTGFLPPDIHQLGVPNNFNATSAFVDPRRGGNGPVGAYVLVSGGNPDLRHETSTSWSAGLILTPQMIEGLRLSLDYTDIKKKDNITTLSFQQILDNEGFFPARVTRGPNLPGDQPGWAGPVTAIDISFINSASAHLETYDLQLDYSLATATRGSFAFFALGTWMPSFETQVAALSPVLQDAGVVGGSGSIPLKFKANAGLSWASGPLTLGWSARYFDSYYVANPAVATNAPTLQNQGHGGRVKSQSYHDVFAQYRFGTGAGTSTRLTDGMELQVGVRNLFNTRPPYDVSNTFNFYSYLGDERLATYYFSLKKSF